jgi:hypothetical protein
MLREGMGADGCNLQMDKDARLAVEKWRER